MPDFQLGPQDSFYYKYTTPTIENGFTCIFFNALTGDTSDWETLIGPRLREAGHGALAYNLGVRTNSEFSSGLKLNVDLTFSIGSGTSEQSIVFWQKEFRPLVARYPQL